MNEIKLCSSCKFANPLDTTVCVRCGTTLGPLLTAHMTPNVPNPTLQPTLPNHERFVAMLSSETLIFVIAGEEQPILARKSPWLILGREASDEISSPKIDLNSHNGFLLGVSRQHATLEFSKGRYFLHDLESTNGTWVNDLKLIPHKAYPLQNGDLIRLGQMGLYVYFRTVEITSTGCLITDATAPITLTPEYLITKIGPYLKLLSDISNVVDTLLEHTQFRMTVKSLSTDPTTNQIHLDCTINDSLLHFLEMDVVEWKKGHDAEIRKLWELEERPTRLNIDSEQEPFPAGYTQLRETLELPLSLLVRKFLSEISPEESETETKVYFDKLMSLFYRLVYSPLQLEGQMAYELRS